MPSATFPRIGLPSAVVFYIIYILLYHTEYTMLTYQAAILVFGNISNIRYI